MKYQRAVLLLLILLLAVCLCACGAENNAAGTAQTAEETAPEPTPESTPEPTPEPTPVPVFDILGTEYDYYAEEIDLSAIAAEQVSEVAETLKELPFVTKINLLREDGSCALTAAEAKPLLESAPEAEYICAFTLLGESADQTTEELRYTKLKLSAEQYEEIRATLPFLKNLKLFRIAFSHLDDDEMAAIRDEFPEKNVVWSVYLGKDQYMSDTTKINTTEFSDASTDKFKYLRDVLYFDTGHNLKITNVEFLRYFPKLQVCIIAITNVTDISPLADCPDLEYLELFTTGISDLTPLQNLTKLEHLNIANMVNLSDITPLYGLTNLKRLRLDARNHVPQEQRNKIVELLPDCQMLFRGGGPSSDYWRYNEDGSCVERYALLREQFAYDLGIDARKSNSPSEKED